MLDHKFITQYITTLKPLSEEQCLMDINRYYCLYPDDFRFLMNNYCVRFEPTFIKYIKNQTEELCLNAVRNHYMAWWKKGYERLGDIETILNYIYNQTFNVVRFALRNNITEIQHVNIDFSYELQQFIFGLSKDESNAGIELILMYMKDIHPRVKKRFITQHPIPCVIQNIGELDDELQQHCVRCSEMLICYLDNPSKDTIKFAIRKSLRSVYYLYELEIELDDELKYDILERYWYTNSGSVFSDDIYNLVMNKMGGNGSKALRYRVNKLKLMKE